MIVDGAGMPAKAVGQSQQRDGCEDDKLEQDDAAMVMQQGCGNECGTARVRQRG